MCWKPWLRHLTSVGNNELLSSCVDRWCFMSASNQLFITLNSHIIIISTTKHRVKIINILYLYNYPTINKNIYYKWGYSPLGQLQGFKGQYKEWSPN